ncbi:MAG: phosphoglycerate kinase [Bacillota bacterium]
MDLNTVKDMDVKGKRVFVRVDFNVSLDESGNVKKDTKIRASLPTIQYLLDNGAKVILASHLGRPKGQVQEKFSLKPVAKRLERLLGRPVMMAGDCVGPNPREIVAGMKPGDVVVLENIRFHPEEEANDPAFAKQLAELAEIYVSDAFGTAHRAHASTTGIAEYLPAAAGFLMEKEYRHLDKAVRAPEKPYVIVVGGAKADKTGIIENLLDKVDTVLIGGGMAVTFLKAQGHDVGRSPVEDDKVELAKNIMESAKQKGVKIILPVDVVVADGISPEARAENVDVTRVPADKMILDIGSKTAEIFADAIKTAKTVFWNGPLGVFEIPAFARGTETIARAVAESGASAIIGGGESAAAMEQVGITDKIYISTGGGASLKFLEGKGLPGIKALEKKNVGVR